MTPQAIDAMVAGRELDRLVAEKVMGWKNLKWQDQRSENGWITPAGFYGNGPKGECFLSRSFSTDSAAAWQVKRKITESGIWGFHLTNDGNAWSHVSFTSGTDEYEGEGDTDEEAICRAAWKAAQHGQRGDHEA